MDHRIIEWIISILPEISTLIAVTTALIVSRFKLQKTRNELELKRIELEKSKLEYAQNTDTIFSKFILQNGGSNNETKVNKEKEQ